MERGKGKWDGGSREVKGEKARKWNEGGTEKRKVQRKEWAWDKGVRLGVTRGLMTSLLMERLKVPSPPSLEIEGYE